MREKKKEVTNMTNTLQLLKSEKFGEIQADIYTNSTEMFMTINQLAECLGYADKSGVEKIVQRNEYLKTPEFSSTAKLSVLEGSRTVSRETRLFNEQGIYEVAFLSKTEIARQFRSWVRGILTALRKGELQLSSSGVSLSPQIINEKLQQLIGINKQLIEDVADLYESLELVSNSFNIQNSDLHDDLQKAFMHLEEKIDSFKPNNQPVSIISSTSTHLVQSPADIIRSTIQPLIEKYKDNSVGGNGTYRKVYAAMSVSWQNRKTRYKNEHHLKNQPKKITLIEQDKKLMKLFVETVNVLLSEPFMQEV